MRTIPLQCTLWDDDDNAIHVTGALIPGMRATRDEYGAPESPDDEPEVEITGAEDDDGNEDELSEEQQEEAMEKFND